MGVVRDAFYEGSLAAPVARSMSDLWRSLRESGVLTIEIRLDGLEDAASDFFKLLCIEALATHGRLLAQSPELFGDNPRRRLESARSTSETERAELYSRAASWREVVMRDAFQACDILLTPMMVDEPPRFADPELVPQMGRNGRFTFPWSLARLPALSLSCGAFPSGLPIGCQLVGPPGNDFDLLELGIRFQRITDWHRRRPPIRLDISGGPRQASATR